MSTPDLNPNLVRIYLDAQHDYLEGRVYLLGALVVACKDGSPIRQGRSFSMTDGPPDTAAKERQLFVDWTRELLNAVVELASPCDPPGEKKSAPIHVVFFDRHEQRVMLEAWPATSRRSWNNAAALRLPDADRRLRLAHRQLS